MSNKENEKPSLITNEDLISRIINRLDSTDIKMDAGLSQIDTRLRDIDQTILRNALSLEEHMRRTDILERAVMAMEARITPIEKRKIEEDAIKRHKHEQLIRIGKVLAALAALSGLLVWAKPLLIKLLIS